MRQERENRMWRDIGALLDAQGESTQAATKAGQQAAGSIRVATERDLDLYRTYVHEFSDGRDVS